MTDRSRNAYISAGSNIDPEKNLAAALDMLLARMTVTAVSTVYRTAAIGRPGDPDFLNCVFRAKTELPPREVKFGVLVPIEDSLGRVRGCDRYAPRTIASTCCCMVMPS